jgi:hypothetical protein
MREWRAFYPGKSAERIPIPDCHAWEEKECVCSGIKISGSFAIDYFDVVCKKCGKKKRLE